LRNSLIFDLDGTLIDSSSVCVEILQDMLDERASGIVIDYAGAAPYLSRGGVHMISAMLGAACGEPEAELREFRARYAARKTPADSLFDGVVDGIDRLQEAGFELAICSNKPENLCLKVLCDLGLDRRFTVVVGGRPGLRPKPALDLLEATLDELGANADACCYIGDSELDHALAEAARIPFHFMTYGYAAPGWRPSDGTRCFDDFPGLVDVLVAMKHDSSLPTRAA
jgi:phosphoglycolate phosphatase